MKRADTPCFFLVLLCVLSSTSGLRAQVPTKTSPPDTELERETVEEDKKAKQDALFKKLDDAEAIIDEKLRKEKERLAPPFELMRSQVAPFDALPFVKPYHWSTMGLEMQANLGDFSGEIESSGVKLPGMTRLMVYARKAALSKGKHTRLSLELFLPNIPKFLGIELSREDFPGPVYASQAALRTLPQHQMLVLVLAKNPNAYSGWNRFHAVIPLSSDRDASALDKTRYYRFVVPLEPTKPYLSINALTWTSISHAVWDDLPAETLNLDQQQALLDWLHWGGQLVVNGGAGSWYAPIKESVLGPYLPADLGGENALLDRDALDPLAKRYRPLVPAEEVLFRTPEDDKPAPQLNETQIQGFDPMGSVMSDSRYKPAEPILPDLKRPVYFAGLVPRKGVQTRVLRAGDSQGPIVAVERRIGRGRIIMLSMNLNDPALAAWTGLDTFVRRVVFRRQEEEPAPQGNNDAMNPLFSQISRVHYRPLEAPDLTWFRIFTRDFEAQSDESNIPEYMDKSNRASNLPVPNPTPSVAFVDDFHYLPQKPAAAWRDDSGLPKMARDMLIQSSGISVPGSRFVLTVLLAYIITLVPLNWLICRFVFGKKEWAWAVMPILSLGFAVGVERAAAFDLGYDLASSEIDVLEIQGDYPRGHVSRFASLYSSGRKAFAISFPDNPTALALPMDSGATSRAEEFTQSIFESYPVPTLKNFPVQPRSLSLYRTEEFMNTGGIRIEWDASGAGTVFNDTNLELWDAQLISNQGNESLSLGRIPPRGSIPLAVKSENEADKPNVSEKVVGKLDPKPFLEKAGILNSTRPEDRDEVRLTAWTPGAAGGMAIEPAVERRLGITIVVAHVSYGTKEEPTPSDSSRRFDALAALEPTAAKNAEAK